MESNRTHNAENSGNGYDRFMKDGQLAGDRMIRRQLGAAAAAGAGAMAALGAFLPQYVQDDAADKQIRDFPEKLLRQYLLVETFINGMPQEKVDELNEAFESTFNGRIDKATALMENGEETGFESSSARGDFGRFDAGSMIENSSHRLGGMLDMIAKHESNGDYNSVFNGARDHFKGRDLTSMTVGQVLEMQDAMVREGSASSAAGRYQFLRKTTRGLINQGIISENDMFDQATQDKMAVALMEGRGLSKFLSGEWPASRFANELAKEWASFPAADGRSHYAGDGLNKALVSRQAVMHGLGEMRNGPEPSFS